jgi:hypothetical protein
MPLKRVTLALACRKFRDVLEPDAFRFVHILHLRSSLYIPLRCRFREVGRWLR